MHVVGASVDRMIQSRSVAIVGTGSVGVAAAFGMFMRRTASEILLLDKDPAKAEGHAMDLMHGQALVGRVAVEAASYADLSRALVVVIAAGRSQKKGETRLDLLRGNAEVLRDVVRRLDEHAPSAVLLVATNPVDVLTRLASRWSARPRSRVIGTGTALDSARFRALLAAELGVSPRSVHAQVLGEHGDSQVPIWSRATVGGLGVDLDAGTRERITAATKNAARDIIQRKGYTDLAIGTVIAQLVHAIVTDERSVQPLSVPLDGEYGLGDVALSVPVVLGAGGAGERVLPELSPDERRALEGSAEALRAAERAAGLAPAPASD